MKQFDLLSESEEQTRDLGQRLGSAINGGCIIFLEGTLGTGKTRLAQAIACGLGINPETVNSPTFTIMMPHTGRLTMLHLDAYRIKDLNEADQLGIDDWVESGCVLVVEWAERIEAVLPPPDLKVSIQHVADAQRHYLFTATTPMGERLLDSLNQTA